MEVDLEPTVYVVEEGVLFGDFTVDEIHHPRVGVTFLLCFLLWVYYRELYLKMDTYNGLLITMVSI